LTEVSLFNLSNKYNYHQKNININTKKNVLVIAYGT